MINVGSKQGTSQLKCEILAPNGDVLEVDFSSGDFVWQYLKF